MLILRLSKQSFHAFIKTLKIFFFMRLVSIYDYIRYELANLFFNKDVFDRVIN